MGKAIIIPSVDFSTFNIGQIADYSKKYLTLEAIDDCDFYALNIAASDYIGSLSYSIDNGDTWNQLTVTNAGGQTPITVHVTSGTKMLLRGSHKAPTKGNLLRLKTTGQTPGSFNVSGNIMSIVNNWENPSLSSGLFKSLFTESNVVNAENLVLPATTLAESCYQSMFKDCTSLTTAPELPATTLAADCYHSMFQGCFNLNEVTCLATDISAYGALDSWLSGVSSTGTFYKASGVTWPRNNNGIPSNWTVVEV